MRFLVTLGPTFEPLDKVRRLTNFSTGRLGTELANHLVARGHEVLALRGHYSTTSLPLNAQTVQEFSTTESLLGLLKTASAFAYDAVFHAAAVSDFRFGRVFGHDDGGPLQELKSGKFTTRSGRLLAELIPTPKLIGELRRMFPESLLIGWKYEVEGTLQDAVAAAERQLRENRTDYCVLNGPAYGGGFALIAPRKNIEALPDVHSLCERLLRISESHLDA